MQTLFSVMCFLLILGVGLADPQRQESVISNTVVDAEVATLVQADEFKQNERDRLAALGTNAIGSLVTTLRVNQDRFVSTRALGMLAFLFEHSLTTAEQEKEVLGVIQKHLDSEDHLVRQTAVSSLSKLKRVSVVSSALPLLEDNDEFVRVEAARTLAMRGDRTTAKTIEGVLGRRATGLPPERIAKDSSFKAAQEAITAIIAREDGSSK